jgi:23S rRNA (adenine2503-C2)-methyltransferase
MPIANAYTIRECLDACDYYFTKTGRRISYEYALFSGINDSVADARSLSRLLKGRNCHVNLIRANDVKESGLTGSSRDAAMAFEKELEKNGINVTIRRRMGRTVDGACGQLRRRVIAPGFLPGERS